MKESALITIGKRVPQEGVSSQSDVTLDIDALVYSKALIQANSGGGKSGLIRVIAEKVIPHIPTIIIDPEGEFSTLREKLDIVLVGDQGELEADPRSAGLLARKLAELGASAILDIYELKPEAKHRFVKAYLESLMSLPRKLWRPTFIIIDESQIFAPERGMGESIALESVADLLFRGRKRGFGSILATPRLSMLHKNVAGANNIFIGRTNLDTDQARCGKALGKSTKEAIALRDLKPREFYCYGPDLNVDGVTLFRVADCQTTIRKPGDRKTLTPPKASHVVKQIGDKLKDIQQESEVEIRNLNDAKSEIAKLKRELRTAKNGQVPREQDTKRIAELESALAKGKTRTETTTIKRPVVIDKNITRLEALQKDMAHPIERIETLLERAHQERSHIAVALTEARGLNASSAKDSGLAIFAPGFGPKPPIKSQTPARVIVPTAKREAKEIATSNGDFRPSSSQRRILNALAWLEGIGVAPSSKGQLAFMAKQSPTSSTYLNNLSALKSHGLIDYPTPGYAQLKDDGRELAEPGNVPTSNEELHRQCESMVSSSQATILRYLISIYPQAIQKNSLADNVGQSSSSSTFLNNLSRLRTLGLIDYPQPGHAVATPTLFFE